MKNIFSKIFIILASIAIIASLAGVNINAEEDRTQGVVFKYYTRDEFISDMNNGYKIKAEDKNVMKFSIDCLDLNSNSVALPEGSYIPEYIYGNTSSDINVSLFSQISIPGFTFDNGIAFFYWYGTFNSTKYTVSNITNHGRISDNYPNYDSYLGFIAKEGKGHDYKKNDGFYAYNPTGYLQVVYNEVSHSNPYKSVYYIDGSPTVLEDRVEWSNNSYHYYPATISTPQKDGYEFVGWTDASGKLLSDSFFETEIDKDVYLYSKFEVIRPEYTVTFLDADDNILDTQSIKEGDSASAPSVPEITGYDFIDWSASFTSVYSDLTVKAQYRLHNYTINYDLDGGTNDADNPSTFTMQEEVILKEPTKKGYTFTNWSDTDTIASGTTNDVSVKANWNINYYTVKFVDDNDEVISQNSYPFGTSVSDIIVPQDPQKESTIEESYTFAGWDKPITNVEEDVTYKATYDSQINQYTINILNIDPASGEVFGAGTYDYGSEITISTKPNTGYHFVKWNDGDTNPEKTITVTKNMNFTALCERDVFTVTWLNDDDSIIRTKRVPYGIIPKYDGETPTKQADVQYTYTFAGWNAELVPVTQDVTYKATYESNINSYKIEGISNNDVFGFVSGSDTVEYGNTVTLTATSNTGYHFVRWNDGDLESTKVVSADKNITYIAYFEPNIYTISFVDDDETLISQKQYDYSTPVADIIIPENPQKTNTAKETYEFVGWDKTIEEVKQDVTYKAVYTSQINQYKLDVVSLNPIACEVTGTGVYEYNSEVAISVTPNVGYHFVRWSDGNTNPQRTITVTENMSFTALCERNTYIITWLGDDNSTLLTSSVLHGDIPVYDGIPNKEANAQYTYTFIGWDKKITPAVSNTAYIAQYSAKVNSYNIEGTSNDKTQGNVTGSDKAEYGKLVTLTALPNTGYHFVKWDDGDTDPVKVVSSNKNVTYIAYFEPNKYTISFVDEDGSLISKNEYDYAIAAKDILVPENPQKQSDAKNTYNFVGWTPEIKDVTSDVTYVALYDSNLNSYSVKFINEDGENLQESNFPYGSIPEYYGEIPAKESNQQYSYEFIGWDGEFKAIEGPKTFVAKFKPILNNYTITWLNSDGTLLKQAQMAYGTNVVYDGEVPEMAKTAEFTYHFVGWDKQDITVTGDEIITAVYEKETNLYNVTFVYDQDTSVIVQVLYGHTVNEPETPVKENYTFGGWYLKEELYDFEQPVCEDITLVGEMIANGNYYDVTDSASNHYNASLSGENKQEAISASDDKEKFTKGYDIDYYLKVKSLDHEEVDEEERKLINDNLKKNYQVAEYIDITLWKQIMDEVSEPHMISETDEKIWISFKVPEELISENSDYIMLVSHEGIVEELETKYDKETNTLSFATDKFSTYTIAVKKAVENAPVNNTKTVVINRFVQPLTGVDKPMINNKYKIACLIVFASLVIAYKYTKRFDRR